MYAVSRRQFLGRTGVAVSGASYLSIEARRLNANALNMLSDFKRMTREKR
ncbi:MAG: twin-arginine translocation signal domain-containing protein [Bryobacteraceae bacterium]